MKRNKRKIRSSYIYNEHNFNRVFILYCERNKTETVTAKSMPKGAHDSAWRKMFLSPHFSLLSPRFWAVGPIRPSLVRGRSPRNAPLNAPPHRVYGNMTLTTRCDQAFPRVLAHSEYVPAQASQARQLPYMPNVHRDDHREPATEMLTVLSPQADRTQNTHRTWLGSYPKLLKRW